MIITDKINKKIEDLSLVPLSGTDVNSDLILIKCYNNMWSEVNGWLEKNFTPGKVGTEFKIFGFGKDGDYDFSLVALTLIAKKWKNFVWCCQLRVDTIDEDTLRIMKKAG